MGFSHEDIDRRSVVLHAKVAERLREQPCLIEVARANLERWRGQCGADDLAADALSEWQAILDTLSLAELCALLVQQDERAARLRQSSPFAGILSSREVWEIKRQFKSEEAPA